MGVIRFHLRSTRLLLKGNNSRKEVNLKTDNDSTTKQPMKESVSYIKI
jgi:hypothetical protein